MAQALAIDGGAPVVPEGRIQPWPHIGDDERKAVLRALEAATPWRYPNPEVEALEQEWARFVGMKHCLAANSGTASLHMAVAAAEVGPGDEVLVPAFTFLASASCVLHSNGIPIFVDIERETHTINPALLEERITARTKAIVAVDIHGLPSDYEPIFAVARKHGLVVIEDGAQAHGSVYKGRQVGALGDVAGCSLNGSKNLSALGEGGLFTTDDDRRCELAARTRMFGEAIEPGKPRQYNAYMMGWNYRLDPLQAAFARAQLLRLPQFTEWRQRNCNLLTERLRELPGIETPSVPPDRTHSYFFYVFRVQPEGMGLDLPTPAMRDTLQRCLNAEGVPATRWQTLPVPGQSLFYFHDGYGKGCPWSCAFARPGIEYRPEEYPETLRLIEDFLAIGHSTGGLGYPNGPDLMEGYAAAFTKVLVDNRERFVELSRERATSP